MSVSMSKDLAVNIFGVGLDGLDLEKRIFVYLQNKYFEEYRNKIKAIVTDIMGKKYLKGRENDLIKEWFIRRIPPQVVLSGIENCREYAVKNGSPIFSLQYFARWVEGRLLLYKKNNQHTDYSNGGRDPWFYEIFEKGRSNELGNACYDPWVGMVPKSAV